MEQTEILDGLEDIIIKNTVNLFKSIGKPLNYDQARNIIEKIGLRIAFGKNLPKETIDEIILNTKERRKED